MTIMTIFLVLLFLIGIPYLIYEAFIDNGGFVLNLFNGIKEKQDDPINTQNTNN